MATKIDHEINVKCTLTNFFDTVKQGSNHTKISPPEGYSLYKNAVLAISQGFSASSVHFLHIFVDMNEEADSFGVEPVYQSKKLLGMMVCGDDIGNLDHEFMMDHRLRNPVDWKLRVRSIG